MDDWWQQLYNIVGISIKRGLRPLAGKVAYVATKKKIEEIKKPELTDADKEWASGEVYKLLVKYYQTADQLGLKPKKQPKVSVYLYCGCPMAKYGRDTLGRIPLEIIQDRNLEGVEEALFNLPGALTLPIVFSDLPKEEAATLKNQFYGVARTLTMGLQAVYRRRFQGPIEGNLETAAYRTCNEGMDEYLESLDDPLLRLMRPSSNIVATASKDYSTRYGNWEARNSQDKSPPWPKVTGFPIKTDCFSIEITTPEAYRKRCPSAPAELPKEIVMLSLRVLAGASKGQRVAPLVARVQVRGSSDWATLKRAISGTKGYKTTQGRLVLDEGKWVFKLGFKKPRPEPSKVKTALVVIPALNDLAMIYSHEGDYLRGKYKGAGEVLPKGIDSSGFIHLKKMYDSMRSARARHLNFVGRGARGHGQKRFRLSLEVVEGKETDRTNTWMEQQASHLARYANSIGAIVGIDDMVSVPTAPDRKIERLLRRFPWCTFRDKIAWACKKHGVPTKVIKHSGVKDCPMCGWEKTLVDSANYDGRPEQWCRTGCGAVAPKNLFRAWRLFKVLLVTDADSLAVVDQGFRNKVEGLMHIRTRNNSPESMNLMGEQPDTADAAE